MSFKLDSKKFKKIHMGKDHAILRHSDGHELKIALNALSPKMKSQIADLPSHMESKPMADGGEVSQDAPNMLETVAKLAPLFLADGGNVPGGKGSPAIDKKAAEEISKGAQESGWQPEQWAKNLKEGLGIQSKADGGDIQDIDLNKQPEAPMQDIDLNRQPATQQPQDAAPQQAPVIVNVGAAPQIPPQYANPNPGAQFAANSPPAVGQAQPDPGNQPYGIPPQGIQAPEQAQPEAASPQQAPEQGIAQKQPSDPYGTQATYNAALQGLEEQKAGIFGQSEATQQQAQEEAKLHAREAAQQQAVLSEYQKNYNQNQSDYHHYIEAYQNQRIDPKRFMSNMGTFDKVRTAIGLILGGADAYKILRAKIDDDINAQRADMGKQENLVKAASQHFSSLRDGADFARALQMGIVSSQLKQAADKAATPMAKANALMHAGKLDSDSAALLGQVTARKTLLQGMQSGNVPPERVVMALVPEPQKAAAYKELQEAQNIAKVRDNLLASFDKLVDVNTLGNRVTSPFQTPKQVAAIRDPLIASLSKETAGRFTDSDAQMVGSLFPAVGDSAESAAVKRSQLQKLISEKMNFPLLQTYGINVGGLGRYGAPGGQSRIQEAAPVLKSKK